MLTRLVRAVLSLIVTVAMVVFAVANRGDVTVIWSPGHDPLVAPLFAVALGFMIAGFIVGAILVWLNNTGRRQNYRRQKREIRRLRHDLDAANENGHTGTGTGQASPPALRHKAR